MASSKSKKRPTRNARPTRRSATTGHAIGSRIVEKAYRGGSRAFLLGHEAGLAYLAGEGPKPRLVPGPYADGFRAALRAGRVHKREGRKGEAPRRRRVGRTHVERGAHVYVPRHVGEGPPHLDLDTVAEHRTSEPPRYGMTRSGYTKRSGAPTSIEIRLKGERRWRRVMVTQTSNMGTTFVRIAGKFVVVDVPYTWKR